MLSSVESSFVGGVRRRTLYGREHLVAPLVMLVPGVLDGSSGPLYYPADRIANNADAWNGMPILLGHPTHYGQPITGRRADVLESHGIGVVLGAHVRNGKLRAEGWFDIERVENLDPRVLDMLRTGKPIELSTGVYTDVERGIGSYRGRAYAGIVRNLRPDHLAILPDAVGACSLQDGCGVLANIFQGLTPSDVQRLLTNYANQPQPLDAPLIPYCAD